MEKYNGTYIKQVVASNLHNATTEWINLLSPDDIFGMTDLLRHQLRIELSNEEPTLIEGIDDVWCMFFKMSRISCLLNIVEGKI
ncbi:hypothetical protein DBR40_03575 [Pedobacter sp. KBW01]|uniref:hypothetical protein n=1 Tax=Pedobacter sp. KBW01 TaxID=2153364 RepID=UPI000F5B29D5|nr:hypothetical protein [Pedobacter sp. KBW01]RQO79445.1 hypothetical protein DBR40_03575 [Pedobacter sp. KBW01]